MRVWVAFLLAAAGMAEDRATITGKVNDADGKPLEHATVMVYEAGVKKGYSVYCPTCWADCGKHAATDADGAFTITGLSPDLLFTLLVVDDGFSPTYVKKVDPAKGPAETAVLKTRNPIEDPTQFVRGRVVNAHGDPVRDAVVEQEGVTYKGPDGRTGTRFGPIDWIDQLAVTNAKGEFEIAYSKSAVQFILAVKPRGMAAKLFTLPTGAERKTLTVTDGAMIRGRLVQPDGKPVANAEVGLMTHSRRSGTTLPEVRIGTKEDGTFAITNVPAGRIWELYPKMESVANRNIGAGPMPCETKDDGQEVDVGDIVLRPGYTVRGKVTLSDGKPIAADMRITLGADVAWDSQIVPLAADGTFEFRGVPPGVFTVNPAVRGYRAGDGFGTEVLVKSDRSDLVIQMQPDPRR
jgi:protocatechuate 3,4-dioxygenase beta subunit